jgi:hypothetical protein
MKIREQIYVKLACINKMPPKTANYGGIYSGVYERAKNSLNPIVSCC